MNLAKSLVLAPLVLTLAACGGGGADAASKPGTPAPDAFAGTAYQRLEMRGTYTGKNYGASADAARSMVSTCNSVRAIQQLRPQTLPDEVFTPLDTQLIEKYFDTDKSATYTTGKGFDLPDLTRYFNEAKSNPNATPPDCTAYAYVDTKAGRLWLNGVRYRLDYKNSVAVKEVTGASDFVRTPIVSDATVASLKTQIVGTQKCVVFVGSADADGLVGVSGSQCYWDRYPAMTRFLNWPWTLTGSGQIGASSNAVQWAWTTQEAQANVAIPGDKFAIPAGFAVK